MTRSRLRRFAGLVMAWTLVSSGVAAAAWEDESDPLVVARAVADRELFARVIADDEARVEFKVHHDLYWRDATLMSGVAELYDRLSELGTAVPRYLDYLQAWADRDPGGYPFPIFHGDAVCAGQVYIWLYERSGRSSPHLDQTDGMIEFIMKGRKPAQWGTGYHQYWMRFWNDDVHMAPPFLARRGRAAGSQGIPDGRDGRAIAMTYCRAYTDVLGDPETGLYWHDRRTIGEYQWARGNGWVAAGMTKVIRAIEDDPVYDADEAWLHERLVRMAATLKDNRNPVGTWNADVLDRTTYTSPETSGTVFFVYMMASLIHDRTLGPEYLPVAQKAWHFLKLSVTGDGRLLRVQPVGAGPVASDFEDKSASYGVGGFLLAAAAVSRLPAADVAAADEVECIRLDPKTLKTVAGGIEAQTADLALLRSDFPARPAGRVQAVVPGRRLPLTEADEASVRIELVDQGEPPAAIFLFYDPSPTDKE